MSTSKVEKSVVSWFEQRLRRKNLTLQSRLYHDCGVDGDDGDELLDAFFQEFNIEPNGINLSQHFNDEPHIFSMLLGIFFLLIHLLQGRFRTKKIPIYIQDCVEAAVNGAWPNISNRHFE